LKIKIYKIMILPVLLYSSEIWSRTLWEKCRIRGFENRILRRIFGPKRDENGEVFPMRNFIVCTVHLIEVSLEKLRWTDHIARMKESRSIFKMLTGKCTEKRLL
jgi:hypothetical protein